MREDQIDGGAPFLDAIMGKEKWTSDWLEITQSMIDAFAAATLDADPMHDDPAWAARNSAHGTTIAYGFQTMSLLAHLLKTALGRPDFVQSGALGSPLNYGFDRLRLVAPVPVGSRVRGIFSLNDRSTDAKGRVVIKMKAVVEIEGCDRPALVGDWLSVWVPAGRV